MGYDKDKSEMYTQLETLLPRKPRLALPTTLLTPEGREIRSPSIILKTWHGFALKQTALGDSEDFLYRKTISKKNKTIWQEQTAEPHRFSSSLSFLPHEIAAVKTRTKPGKSPGLDDILNEMLLRGPEELCYYVTFSHSPKLYR